MTVILYKGGTFHLKLNVSILKKIYPHLIEILANLFFFGGGGGFCLVFFKSGCAFFNLAVLTI